jgi:DMSO/TMAO reductase YedYZ molybdopterin-dependent catalytic subunit
MMVLGSLLICALAVAEPETSSTLTLVDLDGVKSEFTFDDLRAIPQVLEEECISIGRSAGFIGVFEFTGIRLTDILEKAKAAQDASEYRKENMYIVFKGTDGYQVIASWTEILDSSEGRRALIALDKGDKPLPPEEGKFRIVFPGDKFVGRSVKCLASIEIRCADGVVDKKKKTEAEKNAAGEAKQP